MPPVENWYSDSSPPTLSAREGRSFALTLAGGFLFLAALGFWRGSYPVATVAASVAGVSVLAGLFIPGRLGPVRRAWMKFGDAIGSVTTPILMAIVYYLILTPIGLVRRVVAARPMETSSQWHRRPPMPPPERMERQF